MQFVTGEVALSAITDPVRARPNSRTAFYVVFLADEKWYCAVTQPLLFDAARRPLPAQSLPPGSRVALGLDADDWLQAIQIISLADACPFPVAA